MNNDDHAEKRRYRKLKTYDALLYKQKKVINKCIYLKESHLGNGMLLEEHLCGRSDNI